MNEQINRGSQVFALVLGILVASACAQEGPVRAASPNQPASGAPTADFFVSRLGNDNWSGKLADPGKGDGPFATITHARDAVRALHKSQLEPRTVRVVLRGGTYYLNSPLEFGPEDSGTEQAPVVYAARAGEKVVLSGGRPLGGGR